MITVTIPTMWKSNELEELLTRYNDCEYIDEIILIDNDPDDKPVIF